MTVREIREIVKGMEMSADALLKVEEMLEELGEDTKEVGDEVIDKILAIIDVEMDAQQLAGDIYQNGVEMTDELLSEIEKEASAISDDLEEVAKKDNP